MGLPSYKDIVELVKTGATIEAQERIMELRQAALDLQEENMRLRNRVSELEKQVKTLERAEGEPCPRCHKRAWAVTKSQPDPKFGIVGGVRRTYKCAECGFTEEKLVTPK
jgi:ribosomal protein L37E